MKTFFIKNIAQMDNHTFRVDWSDGEQGLYRLSDVQANCPCAKCAQGNTTTNKNVKADKIESVGHYAIKIHFSEGCAYGIYDFDLLRYLSGKS